MLFCLFGFWFWTCSSQNHYGSSRVLYLFVLLLNVPAVLHRHWLWPPTLNKSDTDKQRQGFLHRSSLRFQFSVSDSGAVAESPQSDLLVFSSYLPDNFPLIFSLQTEQPTGWPPALTGSNAEWVIRKNKSCQQNWTQTLGVTFKASLSHHCIIRGRVFCHKF